jgi:uncharacterized protein
MRAKPQIGVLLLLAVEFVTALLLFAAPTPAAAQFFDFFGGGGRGRQQGFIPFFDQPRARPRVQARPVPGMPAQQSDYSRAPAQTPPKSGSPDTKNVVVLGDSMADWLANGLEQAYADAPEVAVVRNTRPGSSLIFNPGRHDPRTSVDWPVAAREMLGNEPANFIVMMIGVGDRDPIRVLPPRPKPAPKPDTATPGEQQAKPAETPDSADQAAADQGAPDPKAVPISYEFKSEKWAELYGKRIDEMIAALKSKGVPVFWVGLPPVFGPRSTADMQYLNDLFRKHAEKAGITYIDVWDGFIDEQGRFALQGPDYEGQIRRLRTPDGIFFTPAGARKLAHYVEREIQRALTPTGPIAVRLPEEPLLLQQQPQAAAPGAAPALAPSAGTPRPLAGPVIPLNASVEPSKTAALLGAAAPQQSIADAVANRVLVKGGPVTAPAGRADDFAWPRRAPAAVGADPVAATTDLPMTPMLASNGAAQAQDAAAGAQAAGPGATAPGAGPARARVVQAPAARARPRVSYQQNQYRNPFFFFFGR